MAKLVTDGYLDGGLDAIDGSVTITVCAGQPTSQADIAVKALATRTITGGDFTKADAGGGGRKVTVAVQTNEDIDTTGTADHVVIDNGTDYYVTTCTDQLLTSGGTVTIPAWDITFADPT